MKITEIITEARVVASNDDEIARIIRRDCAPFLAMIDNRAEQYRLWRGSERKFAFFTKQPCPKNRVPRDTDPLVSKIVDDWFLEKMGVRFRSNATFAVGDVYVTENYGAPFSILPIGEFSFCWSQTVGDLTYDLLDEVGLDGSDPEAVRELMDNAGHILNQDMKGAIESGHEIMIHCPAGFYTLKNEENEMSNNFDRDSAILELVDNPDMINAAPTAPNPQIAIDKLSGQIQAKKDRIDGLNTLIRTHQQALALPVEQRAAMLTKAGMISFGHGELDDKEISSTVDFWSKEVTRDKRLLTQLTTQLKKLQNENI